MPLKPQDKQKVIAQFRLGKTDTGSVEVQTGLFTERIKRLTQHLKIHKQDHHSRRGLLRMVNQRRRMLHYLAQIDKSRYQALIKKLGLKK
ncbi:MAG: 30S ribosomal protein S15 [bacterium]|nr:30S ribosomal protein S15 [bacterium]